MTLAQLTEYFRAHPLDVAKFHARALEDLEMVIVNGAGDNAVAINTLVYELICKRIDHSQKIQKGLVIARMLGRRLGAPPLPVPVDLMNGLSHRQMADLHGVSPATVKRWRRRQRKRAESFRDADVSSRGEDRNSAVRASVTPIRETPRTRSASRSL